MDSLCDNRRPVGRLDADTLWSETLTRYEIHPELKAGRSSWRICRHASHLFDLQEQLLSLNVKKNHRSAPLVGTLPYSSCNSCVWTFLQLIMLGQKYSACESMFMFNFPTRISAVKNVAMRMMSVMGSYSAFVLKQALDWRVEHVSRWGGEGGGTPLFGLYRSGMSCWTEGLEY